MLHIDNKPLLCWTSLFFILSEMFWVDLSILICPWELSDKELLASNKSFLSVVALLGGYIFVDLLFFILKPISSLSLYSFLVDISETSVSSDFDSRLSTELDNVLPFTKV